MKVVVVILIILVTFGLPILLQQVINPSRSNTSQTTPTPTESTLVDDIRFLSVPPVLVSANSTFMYKIMATSLAGNEVTLSIISKPDWLSWIPETQQLTGTVPSVGGVFTVTMRAATISGDVQDQTFTVTIDTGEEDVKGAKSVGLWVDPFHPNIAATPEETRTVLPAVTSDARDSAILGEKTDSTATPILTESSQNILLMVLGGILVLVVISIILRIIKTSLATKSKLPPGIVIERGGR